MSHFQKNLVELMEKAQISDVDFAHQLSISRQQLRRWKSGKAVPDLLKAEKIASLLGTTIDSLLKSNDEAIISLQMEGVLLKPESKESRRVGKLAIFVLVILVILSVLGLIVKYGISSDANQVAENPHNIESAYIPAITHTQSTTTPTPTPEQIPEAAVINTEGYGNNPDNLSNPTGGFAVEWGDKLFFAGAGQVCIYSMNSDGSDIKKFRDGNYFGFNVVEESFYFCDGSSIYRLDSNGFEYTYKIAGESANYLCYYNGYLYYCAYTYQDTPTYQMHRIRSDLKFDEVLFDFGVSPLSINVYGTSVYYRNSTRPESGVFETNWETGVTKTISDLSTNSINIHDGHLYSGGTTGDYLHITSIDTGRSTTIPSSKKMSLERVIVNGKIYFNLDDVAGFGVWAYDIEDATREQIWKYNNSNFFINVTGNWMFIRTYIGDIYAIHLPYSDAQLLINNSDELLVENAVNWKKTIISWKDPDLEFCIRVALDKPVGDITFEDALKIKALFFYGNAIATTDEQDTIVYNSDIEYKGKHYKYRRINKMDDLCWFQNLHSLYFSNSVIQCGLLPLSSLKCLTSLYISSHGTFNYKDGTLSYLRQVVNLAIEEGEQNIDLSSLGGMQSLLHIDIDCKSTDYSFVEGLKNLNSISFTGIISSEIYNYIKTVRPDIKIIAYNIE